MKHQSRRTTIIVTFLVAFIAVAAYAKNWQRSHAFKPEQLTATYLSEPRTLSPFSLRATTGKEFTNATLHGQWSVLFFGFVQCNSICPTIMRELSQTLDLMRQAHTAVIPKVYFITLDPERDSLGWVRRYVQSYDADFIGVRGESAETERFAKELAVVYMKVAKSNPKNANTPDEDYDINHSGAVLLVNPHGQLQAIFTPPHKPETLAKEIAIISTHVK